jgi:hypothetical protein
VGELLCFWIESVDSWFFLSFPRYVDSVIRGSGRGEEPSGGNVLRLIQIRRSSVWRKLRQLVKQKTASPNRRFKFQKSRQLFIGTHNETLSVAAMSIRNPDRSPVGLNR